MQLQRAMPAKFSQTRSLTQNKVQVNGQLELLQQALCSAQHATQGLNLQPLVLQLRDAADAIRHSESADDVARADDLSIRLENAASSLSKVRGVWGLTQLLEILQYVMP